MCVLFHVLVGGVLEGGRFAEGRITQVDVSVFLTDAGMTDAGMVINRLLLCMIWLHAFFRVICLQTYTFQTLTQSQVGGQMRPLVVLAPSSLYRGDTIVSMPTPFSKDNIPSGQTDDAMVRKTRTSPLFDMGSEEGQATP